jgi:hypothetical protein
LLRLSPRPFARPRHPTDSHCSANASTAGTPHVIACAEAFPEHIAIPRGCGEELEELLRHHHVRLTVHDQRTGGEPGVASFHGSFTAVQTEAARLLAYDTGGFVGLTATPQPAADS